MVKKITTVCLSFFIVFSIVYLVISVSGSKSNSAMNGPGTDDKPMEDMKIIVYYFHTTYRCYSCTRIEKLTRQCVESEFSDLLSDGRLVIKSVNVQEAGNEQFIKNYQLFTKSVVLANSKSGSEHRWKRLDRTWELLRNESGFKKYIYDELSAFIANKG